MRGKLVFHRIVMLIAFAAGCGAADFSDETEAAMLSQAETEELATKCSVSPTYANCNGRDPMKQGCDDAVARDSETIALSGGAYGTVTLRYSAKCRSAWARSVATSSHTGLTAEASRSTGESATASTADSAVRRLNSPMLFVGNGASIAASGTLLTLGQVAYGSTYFIQLP